MPNEAETPTRDFRSPLAKARDAWLASPEGQRCLDGEASGRYLKNPL